MRYVFSLLIFAFIYIALLFLYRSFADPPYLDPYYTKGETSIKAATEWIKPNIGKTFLGYRPVAYERDIRGGGADNKVITGCTVAGGARESELVYVRGVYPNKQEALEALREVSKGSKVSTLIENGQPVYHVREEMLEVGVFRVRDALYIKGHGADLVEILNYEDFQPGDVESGSY
jgi:hypothetical protein